LGKKTRSTNQPKKSTKEARNLAKDCRARRKGTDRVQKMEVQKSHKKEKKPPKRKKGNFRTNVDLPYDLTTFATQH